jgi:hypothetical protein
VVELVVDCRTDSKEDVIALLPVASSPYKTIFLGD